MTGKALCKICGEPMPEGEEMFKFHGYSGDCPKPPLQRIHAKQIEMGHGKVDVGRIDWNGRVGIILHPRNGVIEVGQPGVLKGDYWPTVDDVVIWLDSDDGAAVVIKHILEARPDAKVENLPANSDQ